MTQIQAPADLLTSLQLRRQTCSHPEVRAVVRSPGNYIGISSVWFYCVACAVGCWGDA